MCNAADMGTGSFSYIGRGVGTPRDQPCSPLTRPSSKRLTRLTADLDPAHAAALADHLHLRGDAVFKGFHVRNDADQFASRL